MGAPENLALLRANEEPGLIVALVVASGDHDEPIDTEQFVGRVGVAARVHERINLPGDTVQITLQGSAGSRSRHRAHAALPVAVDQAGQGDTAGAGAELEDLATRLVSAAETLAELVDRIPDEVPPILKMNVSDPGRFADLAATNMNFRISDKDEVLQRLDVGQRIRFILSRLEREVARARVMEDVKRQTEVKIEQHQREFYLRQQLRAIQAELGEADPGEKEALESLKKIEEAKLPEQGSPGSAARDGAAAHAVPGVERVPGHPHLPRLDSRHCPGTSARATRRSRSRRSRRRSTTRHYGLNEAKERIIEFLAVRKLRGGDPHGPILCFVGPPGTGKTSLGEAIAKSIGRRVLPHLRRRRARRGGDPRPSAHLRRRDAGHGSSRRCVGWA